MRIRGALIPSRRLGWGLAVCAIIVVGSITLSSNGIVNGFWAGLIALAGGLVGLLFQPQQIPKDHSSLASTSVERIYDMGTNLARVQDTMSDLARTASDPTVTLRLVAAQEILLFQGVLLQRTVTDWDTVSPGVATEVRSKLDAGERRFLELTEGESVDR